jgi:putative transposase
MTGAAATPNAFLQPGQIIEHRRQRYAIVQCLDVETILLRHLVTGVVERVSLGMITLPDASKQRPTTPLPDLSVVPDEDWKIATHRLEVIRPLLELTPYARNRGVIEARAAEFGLHASTLYRWLNSYLGSKQLSSLMPRDRRDKGTSKLAPEVERLVQEVVETYYLTTQRRSIQSTCNEVMRRGREQGLEPLPHYNTVRNRILARTQYVRVAKRLGRKTAENQFRPHTAEFPGADYPLAVVQIDHTRLDIILVDEHHREPLGRPWLTLALDVRTRMVAGYALSLDAPSAMSVGLCLVNAILPKSWTLTRFGLDVRWPLQGIPRQIHTDNAKEFHSETLERACLQYGIDLKYRGKGTPHLGGHVERMMDTIATMVHELPGTTFHGPKDRGEYRSGEQAVFTLSEFEKVLLIQITQVYHQRYHQGIDTTPLARFEADQLGTSERPGTGLMVPDVDTVRLRYDFLPLFEHTVQNYGILYKHLHYYADVLKPWIDEPDPDHPGRKRRFVTRYDPADMSVVYFYDPELRQYFTIPLRDSARPAQFSLWELRAAAKRVRTAGKDEVNEDTLFAAMGEIQELEETARTATKQQRKTRHRRERHVPLHLSEKQAGAVETAAVEEPAAPLPPVPLDLADFDDIEVDE